jgi:hypothetical protein
MPLAVLTPNASRTSWWRTDTISTGLRDRLQIGTLLRCGRSTGTRALPELLSEVVERVRLDCLMCEIAEPVEPDGCDLHAQRTKPSLTTSRTRRGTRAAGLICFCNGDLRSSSSTSPRPRNRRSPRLCRAATPTRALLMGGQDGPVHASGTFTASCRRWRARLGPCLALAACDDRHRQRSNGSGFGRRAF